MARPKTSMGIRDFLAQLHAGCSIVTLATATVKTPGDGMTKKHRVTKQPTTEVYPQGVRREAVGRYLLGNDYENNVNQERAREEKEADFVVAGLWVSKAHPEGAGRHDEQFPQYMVFHADTKREYIQARPKQNKAGKITKEKDSYIDIASGRKLTAAEVEDLKENFLDKVAPNKKQDLEKEIPTRAIAVENVKAANYKRWALIKS